ncbi:MAG: class I mannose-6-phosphate isomerase [Fuerstia sp.]|nr:class I mannose-6-phosphate isomerase [Fuerstiella sp.]
MLPPLVFQPILKRIRWGGRRLGSHLQKPIGDGTDYAESWELADHGNDQSCVPGGPLAGVTLRQLMRLHPHELLGKQAALTQFPLLIKFLDANDWLSLQVHPDDDLARQFDPQENGKTEAWVILDSQPESRICAGLKPGVDAAALRQGLQTGQIEELLHLIPVRPGDCIFIPAGTVHAIGPGILLAEVQQQSNLTFRLHDWGRVDANGQPREIHVEQSIKCTDFNLGPVLPVTPTPLCDQTHVFEELMRCRYFAVRRHRALEKFEITMSDQFRILMFLEGQAEVRTSGGSVSTGIGSTVLIPAESRRVVITPKECVQVLEILCP